MSAGSGAHEHGNPWPPHLDAREATHASLEGEGRAHAKAILLGEHVVLLGAPALAVPLPALPVVARVARSTTMTLESAPYTGLLAAAPADVAATVAAIDVARHHTGLDGEWRVRVDSAIPASGGLGSSAATAAAIVRAFADAAGLTLDAESLHELVQTAERVAHGTPSGVDARAVVANAPVWFQSGATRTAASASPITLVVADTGKAASTRTLIARAAAAGASDPAIADEARRRLMALPLVGLDALAAGDAASLGAAMTAAHAALRELDVSTDTLDLVVEAAIGAGALGAKLTGAGGGGCMLALAPDRASAERIRAALVDAGATAAWISTVEAT